MAIHDRSNRIERSLNHLAKERWSGRFDSGNLEIFMPWNNVSNETCAIMFNYKCDKIFKLGWISKMKGRNEKIKELDEKYQRIKFL